MSDDIPIVLVGGKIETSLWDYSWGDEAQANARLIAAAPELLEACKDLLAFMEQYDLLDWDLADDDRARIDAASAAIAKATGAV